jgi:hypothetical protein
LQQGINMSVIDSYQHACIGIVLCPATYPIVPGNPTHRNVPIYRVDEDVFDDTDWQAKAGDILLGGGSGESAALRIAIPEAIQFFTGEEPPHFDLLWNTLWQAYWSPTEAYVFGEGYAKLGWQPPIPIECWLVEHIIAFLLQSYPEQYTKYRGAEGIGQSGAICRKPSPEEQEQW